MCSFTWAAWMPSFPTPTEFCCQGDALCSHARPALMANRTTLCKAPTATPTSLATSSACSKRLGLKTWLWKIVCCALNRTNLFRAFWSRLEKRHRRSEKALHGLKKVANQADFGTNRRLNIDPPRARQFQLCIL